MPRLARHGLPAFLSVGHVHNSPAPPEPDVQRVPGMPRTTIDAWIDLHEPTAIFTGEGIHSQGFYVTRKPGAGKVFIRLSVRVLARVKPSGGLDLDELFLLEDEYTLEMTTSLPHMEPFKVSPPICIARFTGNDTTHAPEWVRWPSGHTMMFAERRTVVASREKNDIFTEASYFRSLHHWASELAVLRVGTPLQGKFGAIARSRRSETVT